MATVTITAKLANEMLKSGYPQLSKDDLEKLKKGAP